MTLDEQIQWLDERVAKLLRYASNNEGCELPRLATEQREEAAMLTTIGNTLRALRDAPEPQPEPLAATVERLEARVQRLEARPQPAPEPVQSPGPTKSVTICSRELAMKGLPTPRTSCQQCGQGPCHKGISYLRSGRPVY